MPLPKLRNVPGNVARGIGSGLKDLSRKSFSLERASPELKLAYDLIKGFAPKESAKQKSTSKPSSSSNQKQETPKENKDIVSELKELNDKESNQTAILTDLLKESKNANDLVRKNHNLEKQKSDKQIEEKIESSLQRERNIPGVSTKDSSGSSRGGLIGILLGIVGTVVSSLTGLASFFSKGAISLLTKSIGGLFSVTGVIAKTISKGFLGLIKLISGLISSYGPKILSGARGTAGAIGNGGRRALSGAKRFGKVGALVTAGVTAGSLLFDSSEAEASEIPEQTTTPIPENNDEESSSIGRDIAEIAGSVIGTIIGTSLGGLAGGGVASIATGAAGGLAGEALGSAGAVELYDWLFGESESTDENTEATRDLTRAIEDSSVEDEETRLERDLQSEDSNEDLAERIGEETSKSLAETLKETVLDGLSSSIEYIDQISAILGGGGSSGRGFRSRTTGSRETSSTGTSSTEEPSFAQRAVTGIVSSNPLGALAMGAINGVSSLVGGGSFGEEAATDTGSGLNLSEDQKKIAKLIYDKFKAAGFSDVQARAAVANAWQESRFNPQAVGDNGASIGLFQANTKGGEGRGHSREDLMNPEYNTDVIIAAAKRSENFMNADNIDDAVKYFTKEVERPADRGGTEVRTRQKHAQDLSYLDYSSEAEPLRGVSGAVLDVVSDAKDTITDLGNQIKQLIAPSIKGGDTVNSGNTSSTTIVSSNDSGSGNDSARRYLDKTQSSWGFA